MIGLVFAAILALQEPSSQAEVRDVCSARSFSQVAFGECLEVYVAQSAGLLAKAENDASARIDQWDEEARYRAQAKAALTSSSTAFRAYRAKECGFADALAGGSIGTAHDHWRLACLYELNIRRAASLDGFVASLPRRGA
jgi:uncharacterized protein YecT (DUF1311 family)